ncbi:LysR family transcriptional regulator [Clostridium sp. D53t1_180928_C8]|uniref:LysR family transcriptional regulator n=1 Tax=Clostridium sp. D53t1_180928_C8 TaxID=2787101 RepID=UPI0018AA5576|nr:LysR family transcriptional regulator [Clostridium sp. D53t1_180928_C8]
MNLQQLEYFKIIAETKNFTTASNILLVTQPALSKAISKLEEELNVPLFEREGRNIKITKFGEVFLKYAESALNDIERGIEKIQDMKKNNDRVISVSSTYCIGATFMPFLISNFLNNNMQTKFNFNNQTTVEILKDLKYGKIDFGFFDNIDSISNYPEIEVALVKKEEYVLIVPKNHSLANKEDVYLKELKEENFIVYNSKDNEKKISYAEIIGYNPKISVEPTEASMLAGLVSAGAGIAIVINTPMINTNKISKLKIKDEIGYKNIYMAWNKEAYISKIADEFKDYILENISHW